MRLRLAATAVVCLAAAWFFSQAEFATRDQSLAAGLRHNASVYAVDAAEFLPDTAGAWVTGKLPDRLSELRVGLDRDETIKTLQGLQIVHLDVGNDETRSVRTPDLLPTLDAAHELRGSHGEFEIQLKGTSVSARTIAADLGPQAQRLERAMNRRTVYDALSRIMQERKLEVIGTLRRRRTDLRHVTATNRMLLGGHDTWRFIYFASERITQYSDRESFYRFELRFAEDRLAEIAIERWKEQKRGWFSG